MLSWRKRTFRISRGCSAGLLERGSGNIDGYDLVGQRAT
jgi:hypothetical protein